MATTIAIEVFDDGHEPPTCARDFMRGDVCPQLRTVRFGTAYVCQLFMEGRSGPVGHDYLDQWAGRSDTFIMPHAKCLAGRGITESDMARMSRQSWIELNLNQWKEKRLEDLKSRRAACVAAQL